MNNRRTIFILFAMMAAAMLFSRCGGEDEVTSREYPRVRTLEVTNITDLGATFEGEILNSGKGPITEYGFVWDEAVDPSVGDNEKKTFTDAITTGRFSFGLATALQEGVTYYVRAYARNAEYLVYGKNVTFVSLGASAPAISAISPLSGTVGDTVAISGTNFGILLESKKVKFDELTAVVDV